MSGGLKAELTVGHGESFILDISLSIAPGTTVALLGPNAAGKSTTVAALAGLLPLSRGSITLNDRPLDNPEQDLFVTADKRGIGVVFQDYLLFPHLTVAENIAFGLRKRRLGSFRYRRVGGVMAGAVRPGGGSAAQAERSFRGSGATSRVGAGARDRT